MTKVEKIEAAPAPFAKMAAEFPDFDQATLPIIPSHWTEASWHNDACPSFQPPWAPQNMPISIYVDYADPKDREVPEKGPRYSVIAYDPDTAEAVSKLDTDDWRLVLAWEYETRIGYDPFMDDPEISEAEIAQILADHWDIS